MERLDSADRPRPSNWGAMSPATRRPWAFLFPSEPLKQVLCHFTAFCQSIFGEIKRLRGKRKQNSFNSAPIPSNWTFRATCFACESTAIQSWRFIGATNFSWKMSSDCISLRTHRRTMTGSNWKFVLLATLSLHLQRVHCRPKKKKWFPRRLHFFLCVSSVK